MVTNVALPTHHCVPVEQQELNAQLQPFPIVMIVLEPRLKMMMVLLVRYYFFRAYFFKSTKYYQMKRGEHIDEHLNIILVWWNWIQ